MSVNPEVEHGERGHVDDAQVVCLSCLEGQGGVLVIRQLPLSRLRNVISNFVLDQLHLALLVLDHVAFGIFFRVLDPVLVEPFYGVCVGKAEERPGGGYEVRVKKFD